MPTDTYLTAKDAKDLFNITHSIIPDRPGLPPAVGNGWLME